MPSRKLPLLLLLALLFFAAVARAQSQPAPGKASLPRTATRPVTLTKETVDRHVKSMVDGEYCPAMVVGVIDSTGTNVYGYGKTNKENGVQPNGDTIFEIGSVTKIFTATCFAQMLDAKQVRLNQAADSIITDYKIPADIGNKIWLSHLVTHTSGLPLNPTNLNSPRPDNPYFGYSQRQFQDFLAGFVLPRAPGDKYEYSHVGYAILGQALAKKDGKTFEQMITDRISTPLGLKDTRIVLPDAVFPRLAHAYTVDGDKVELWDNPVMEGALGLKSTANDMLKFAAAHIGATEVKFAPALRAMQERQIDADRQNDMGFGWQIGRRLGILWHAGETGGYHTFFACIPRHRAAVVILANSSYPAVDIVGVNLVRALLGESGAEPFDLKKPVKVDPILLDKFVGDYQAGRQTLSVTRDGDHIYIAAAGQRKLKLYAQNENTFFGKAVDRLVEFGQDPDSGKPFLIFTQPGGPSGVIRVPAQKIQ